MGTIDPLRLVRNTATLEAYRHHQRAIPAAAQPWPILAIVALLVGAGLAFHALFHDDFRSRLLAGRFVFVCGLASLIAGIQTRLYSRAHLFELPEPPSASGVTIGRWL